MNVKVVLTVVGMTAAFVAMAAVIGAEAGSETNRVVIGGEDWVPLEDSTAIREGSVLDFSKMP